MRTQTELTEAALPDYLRTLGLLEPWETAAVEKAGDGNINWVRRVRLRPSAGGTSPTSRAEPAGEGPAGRSFIVKQARPALERFPQYRVSTERLVFEARWLERARPFDRDGICPGVHGFDEPNRVLVLEDLGDAERLDTALARGARVEAEAAALGAFLGRIHRATQGEPGLADRFRNDAMRRLHGEHIFVLPFRENDFPLPPRTRARADALLADAELRALADAAYARYLEPRGALVHGDVQAANVLLLPGGPKLLDAEIAHVGDPAFDVGTLVAHLLLAGLACGEPRRGLGAVRAAWHAYAEADGAAAPLARFADAARYAGLELLRRTLGAARVAAVEEDEAGLRVVEAGLGLVRTPPESPDGLVG